MREILFRGKRIDNGEWVHGSFCMDALEQYNGLCGVDGFIRLYDKEKGKMQTHEVDRETVGQYTGLTDKNGKRIFEGDICRVTRSCVLAYGKITFQNGCFWFVDDGPGGMLRLCDVKTNGFKIEVIGNIHDNPELVKEEPT